MKMLGISIIKRGLYILTKWQFVKSFWKKEESLFFIYLLSEKRSFLTESFFDLDWPLVSNSIAVKDVHTPDHITKTRFSRCSYSSSSFPSSSKKIYSYIYTTSNILMRPRSSVNWLKILSFFSHSVMAKISANLNSQCDYSPFVSFLKIELVVAANYVSNVK